MLYMCQMAPTFFAFHKGSIAVLTVTLDVIVVARQDCLG